MYSCCLGIDSKCTCAHLHTHSVSVGRCCSSCRSSCTHTPSRAHTLTLHAHTLTAFVLVGVVPDANHPAFRDWLVGNDLPQLVVLSPSNHCAGMGHEVLADVSYKYTCTCTSTVVNRILRKLKTFAKFFGKGRHPPH